MREARDAGLVGGAAGAVVAEVAGVKGERWTFGQVAASKARFWVVGSC